MLDNNQSCDMKDMELLRLVLRACDHSTELFSKVILACHGYEFPEVASAMSKTVELLSEMEGRPIVREELVQRIAEAEPKDAVSF